jgi:hypothetical protein
MAADPEALAQLARLLGDERLRRASIEEVQLAIDRGSAILTEGLVNEAAASDDVTDRASGIAFLEARLQFLQPLLTREQHTRLHEAIEEKLASW